MYTPIALIHKGIPNRIPIPRSPVMKRKHPGRRASPSRMPQRRIRGDISPSFVTLAENNDFPEPIIEDDLKGIRGWRHLTRGALISSEDLYQNRVSHFWPALSSEPIWHWCKPLCSLFPCRDVARFPGAFWTTLKAIIQGIIISLINAFRAFLGENPTRMINHRPFFSLIAKYNAFYSRLLRSQIHARLEMKLIICERKCRQHFEGFCHISFVRSKEHKRAENEALSVA